ncbi:glycosyltransferase family 2 protein [Mycobacterium cookii]|uniref:Transferase n=1 Tax=Mycobacterium cookii TaxID=1775 RepID=A0A7I7KZ69_9MYCO|nr:glycosyltransferase family 2 protein [Mycobacterium cookii]MCV7331489.1 glycosyltransferase family 2 protein [Mycobacterium cookii]BBX46778.1 transferase [Mycobacterium cookii]
MPSQTSDAWIVVPAFNEAGVIGDVIAALRSVFANVVCVDDGSADGTGDIALRAGAHLVRHPVNLGQGAAIQTGVEYARSQPGAQVFATFDADGQHRVQDVVTMIERLGSGDVDIVIGTRFGQGVSRPPLLKRLVLQTAVRLSPRGRRLGLTDTNNGLRVFNKTVADGLDITMNGMSHATEFVMLIAENHWRVAEQPVEVLYTEYSSAKGQPLLNGVNIVVDGFLRGRMPR